MLGVMSQEHFVFLGIALTGMVVFACIAWGFIATANTLVDMGKGPLWCRLAIGLLFLLGGAAVLGALWFGSCGLRIIQGGSLPQPTDSFPFIRQPSEPKAGAP